MICNLFTGLATGIQLRQPLGDWTSDYQWYRFWKWHLAKTDWLLFQPDQQTTPKVAILVWSQCRHLTFLLPIPMNQLLAGSPVMPNDIYHCTINLPVAELPESSNPQTAYQSYASLFAQFCTMLAPWQWLLFGPISCLNLTKQLLLHWKACDTISLVSDASVQKSKHSGFAWVLNHNDQVLWKWQESHKNGLPLCLLSQFCPHPTGEMIHSNRLPTGSRQMSTFTVTDHFFTSHFTMTSFTKYDFIITNDGPYLQQCWATSFLKDHIINKSSSRGLQWDFCWNPQETSKDLGFKNSF